MPQPPQLFSSAVVSAQSEPQSVCAPAQSRPEPAVPVLPVVPAVPVTPLDTEPEQPAIDTSNARPRPVVNRGAAFIHGRIPDEGEGDLVCHPSLAARDGGKPASAVNINRR